MDASDTESVASCRLSNGDEEVEHAREGTRDNERVRQSIAVDVESGGTQCAGSRGVGKQLDCKDWASRCKWTVAEEDTTAKMVPDERA